MLSRTIIRAHRTTARRISQRPTARLVSSKPGETVGGTKTDHTKEFEKPSQSQKPGRQHTQEPGDTVAKGGSKAQESSVGSAGRKEGGGGGEQESGQHVGPMGSG